MGLALPSFALALAALTLAPLAAGCGMSMSAGSSLVRSGTQTITFSEELADEPGVPADVEVSSRSDNFDFLFLGAIGPGEISVGYGVQLNDVRTRDAMAAPGTARLVSGASAFSDRVLLGASFLLFRQPGGEVRPYAQLGVTGIARELTFGARPTSSLEAGVELDLFGDDTVGMSLRLGVTRESGYAERSGFDGFFESTSRGRYHAVGFVASLAFRLGRVTEAFQ